MEEAQVLACLERQNARFAPSPARDAHLRALRAGAPAVVTGQQVGLFLGPLFTLHKAATAIRLARETGAVPVFWLQTEDHDLAEIAEVGLARPRSGPWRIALSAAGEAVSIAHRTLPASVREALAAVEAALGPSAHLDRLARHYRPGVSWGDAFAGVVSELFAEEGLVLLDPRDPALAAAAGPVHRRAIAEWREIAEDLRGSGAAETVHVRDDAPLSFFHPAGPEGRRCRLRWNGSAFAEVGSGRVHAREAVLAADPACFSTSALLRPILQDTWLRTAAYVAGPSEAAYFEQLGPLYDRFGLPRPKVVRRASLRLLEEDDRRRLERSGLSADALARPFDEVLAGVRGRFPSDAPRHVRAALDAALDVVAPDLREAGDRAARALERTRGAVARAAARFERNVDRAWRERDEVLVADVKRLQERLYPGGVPQERAVGMTYFAARHGERALVERVLAAATPGTRDVEL
ncbi:MAG TPA: bacillithiol biosynthesis cysteine-adding enzyme BshC [Candidatus Polarisedimenticolaceae bacterium]